MGDFVTVPYVTSADDLTDTAIDSLRAAIPGWEPADGNLEVWLITAVAQIVSELTTVAASVPAAVFQQFGTSLIGLPQVSAVPATITTTWTAQDTAGYTAPAGTQVGYPTSGDTILVFAPTADVVIPAGATNLGGVTLTAVTPGAGSNGVPVGPLTLVDSLSFIDTVAATTTSAGGVDAETDDAYLARLAADLRLLTPRPILPGDFAVLARNVTGVTRAYVLDGYDPGDSSTGNARMVCVFPLDAAGAPSSAPVRAAVAASLDGQREVTFVVNTATATSTTINVTYSVHVATGYDAATVVAACTAAATAYLSPVTWAGGDQSPPVWTGDNKVRYLSVSNVIAKVPGVAYVASLAVNSGTSDVTMSGVAPLPAVGTISGSAV